MFTRKQANGRFLAILIYADDMIIARNDAAELSDLKRYLHTQFHMKDLGQLKYFLRLEIARSGVYICPRKYTVDLWKEMNMVNA